MSRVDHEAQNAVTRSRFAFSAVVNSAADKGSVEPSAASPVRPAAPMNERRSSSLSERVGIEGVPRRDCDVLTAVDPIAHGRSLNDAGDRRLPEQLPIARVERVEEAFAPSGKQ